MIEDDTEEFVEILGSEYKEPEPKVFVLLREDRNDIRICNKKELPVNALYMGMRVNKPHIEEWWSEEYFDNHPCPQNTNLLGLK